MKQFFTLLLVILVSIPVNGQAINQNEQESENVRTTKFFSPLKFHNKKDKDYQTRNLIVKRKTESLKSLEKRYLDSLINQQWDDDFNIWRFSGKEEFTYENDKIKQTLLYIWDNNTSSWLPFQKDEYTFDTNGNLVTEIRSFQFTPNVWSLNKKTVYTYILTSTNHYDLSLEENFVWNSMASQWDSSYKYELTYEDVFLSLELGYEWNQGMNQWVNMSKHEYNRGSPLIQIDYETLSYWNVATYQWDPFSKWEYSYGDFHDWVPDYEIQYRWETNSGGYWIEESKIEYGYGYGIDAFPILTNEIGFSWDSSLNLWENDYKDEYDYDNNFNRTTGTYFEWNETASDWQPYYKDEYIFDQSYDFDDLIGPYYYDEELTDVVYHFENMVIGYRSYEFTNPIWKDVGKMLFYYSNYTNPLQVVDKELVDAVKVYPNPVNDILIVDSQLPLSKVEIYSIFGKKVKEIDNRFEAIPFYNLADGIYIVKIRSEIGVIFKKIIKSTTIL